jgi:predicted acylesterase/phospholipase RssA
VTDRLVGVALSGGGAWTFAHIALLRSLEAAGVPVDFVSGTSGGALVGGYYCALGTEGLTRLENITLRLDFAALLAMVHSRALTWLLDCDLNGRKLGNLDTAFFPIIADIGNGTEFVPRRGELSLSECIRASSTLTPFFGSTDFEGRRCLDGVFVNNTGERALVQEGAANFVIASDAIQHLRDARPSGVLEWVYRLRRIRDGAEGAHLLVSASDGQDAFLKDVTFRPQGLPTFIFPFAGARANVEKAQDQADEFVETRVKPRWQKLVTLH